MVDIDRAYGHPSSIDMRQLFTPPPIPDLTADVTQLTQRLVILEDDYRVSGLPPDLSDTSWLFWTQVVRDLDAWTLTTCLNTRLPTGEAVEWFCKSLQLPTPTHANAVPGSTSGVFSQLLPKGVGITYRVPAANQSVQITWPQGLVTLSRWDGLDANQQVINGVNGFFSPTGVMSGDATTLPTFSVDVKFIQWSFVTSQGLVSYVYPV